MQSNLEMSDRLSELFEKHISGNLTENERIELMGLFLEPSLKIRLQELVANAWYKTGEDVGLSGEKKEILIQKILENKNVEIGHEGVLEADEKSTAIKLRSAKRSIGWRPWAVAASVIFLLGSGTIWMLNNSRNKSNETITIAHHDVEAPKNNKASITLANGSKIDIDSLNAGQFAIQRGVKLVKLGNGQIAYEALNAELTADMQYNTLENPRGSRAIDIRLADGSRVWLNTGSSITYPIAFAGNKREVTVNGEAYFEIAPDVKKPFYVSKGDAKVQVLGTHFNINAYDDEPDIKVTLLEGAVKVSKMKAEKILQPGQQAIVASDISLVNDVDVDQAIAWKNGLFSFQGASLESVMRQIARWYDMEIVFKGAVPQRRFGGKIHMDANLSKVLEILKESNVHYEINNREIIINP